MAFGSPQLVYQLTMHFSYGTKGWQEILYLDKANLATARPIANLIIPMRINCLPDGAELRHAGLSDVDPPRDGTLLDAAYPVDGAWGDISNIDDTLNYPRGVLNSPNDCIHLRLEDNNGNYANRWMHGIPDPEVFDDKLVTSLPTATLGAAPLYVDSSTLTTWIPRVLAYMNVVKNVTVMFRSAVIGNNTVNQVSPIERIISKGLSSRRCGRPFGLSAGKAPIG